MRSRYDFMKQSKVYDSEDGQSYPDPLSVKYVDTQLSVLPEKKILTSADLDKFWLFMQKNYGMSELDDILLTINGVAYIGDLEPGDVVYLISSEDLTSFNNQKKPGKE